jgi:hypothetical protein
MTSGIKPSHIDLSGLLCRQPSLRFTNMQTILMFELCLCVLLFNIIRFLLIKYVLPMTFIGLTKLTHILLQPRLNVPMRVTVTCSFDGQLK